jgi:hypothetical protein
MGERNRTSPGHRSTRTAKDAVAKPFKNVIFVIDASKVLALFCANHVGQSETFPLNQTNRLDELSILTRLGLPSRAHLSSGAGASSHV